VHSQQAAGGALAVAAGVDSVEHGMCLDPDLLPRMAEQGTALTPRADLSELDRPRAVVIAGRLVHRRGGT
jgi:imidazolonepropionase-like amidohydrolase